MPNNNKSLHSVTVDTITRTLRRSLCAGAGGASWHSAREMTKNHSWKTVTFITFHGIRRRPSSLCYTHTRSLLDRLTSPATGNAPTGGPRIPRQATSQPLNISGRPCSLISLQGYCKESAHLRRARAGGQLSAVSSHQGWCAGARTRGLALDVGRCPSRG